MENSKFTFDLGKAFVNLCGYLTTLDKLNLASACNLLREIMLQRQNWQQFQITDYCLSAHWDKYLQWIAKYMQIIKPTVLYISITEENHSQYENLIKIFLHPLPHVEQLTIRTNSINLHLIVANACPNLSKIVFQSNQINDELVQYMFKHFKYITHIDVNADALEFTCANISCYLKHPLQKLILKPYQLNYDSILELVSNEELNQLNQLQIDVEECPSDTLVNIISYLHFIRKLRLFHMENFDDVATLSNNLSEQITELTLTKCYKLDMSSIISKISSAKLRRLDLTEALCLRDEQVLEISNKSINLKILNISWCNQISNTAVKCIVNNCLLIEKLILNGLKSLTDEAFQQYEELIPLFNDKYYDQIKYLIKKSFKNNKSQTVADIYNQFEIKLSNFFSSQTAAGPKRRATLNNLRLLQCNSCNNVSDKVLKIIYCFNRMAQVINYYGEDLGLFRNSFTDQNFD